MEIKEGVVLDKQGNELYDPGKSSGPKSARIMVSVWKPGLLSSLAIGGVVLLLPAFFIAGFAILSLVMMAFVIMLGITRIFRPRTR